MNMNMNIEIRNCIKIIVGLAILFFFALCVSGCCTHSRLTVYPIRNTDIQVTGEGKEGKVIMSKWYFDQVLQVKLDKGR